MFNNFSPLSVMLTLAATAVRVWLSQKGLTIHPLVEEWVRHFFLGEGTDKVLPSSEVQLTKKAVKESLRELWRNPSWRIHTAKTGEGWGMQFWLCSLGGIIGAFTYSLSPTEEGVQVQCWDLWDFNIGSQEVLQVELPLHLHKPIKQLARLLNIDVQESGSFLRVSEVELAKLNKAHQFYTRWEFFLTWKELGITDPTQYKWEHGGLPIDWFIENT